MLSLGKKQRWALGARHRSYLPKMLGDHARETGRRFPRPTSLWSWLAVRRLAGPDQEQQRQRPYRPRRRRHPRIRRSHPRIRRSGCQSPGRTVTVIVSPSGTSPLSRRRRGR